VAKINEAIRAQSEFRIKAWRTRISNAIVRLRAPDPYSNPVRAAESKLKRLFQLKRMA